MKCIGKDCYYYEYHQFYLSYRICMLDNISFGKDDNRNCPIEIILANKTEDLKELKNCVEYIKQKNNQ